MAIRTNLLCALCCLVTTGIVGTLGCKKTSEESYGDSMAESLNDQLPQTLNYVFTDEQFQYGEFREKVSVGLNRWMKGKVASDGDSNWKSDPLLETLDEQIRQHPSFNEIGLDRFLGTDAHYLQQRLWDQMIAERVSQPESNRYFRIWTQKVSAADVKTDPNHPDDRVAVALASLHPDASGDGIKQLAAALRLFDWSIRNVKLKPTVELPPKDQYDQERLIDEQTDWAPALGIRGPGYSQYNWQTLLYGHGDAFERARVFIALLQQLRIDAAMLQVTSVANEQGDKTDRWMVAVHCGDQFYLFEPALGLPVLLSDSSKIATVADLKADDSVLRGLNLTLDESTDTSRKYWPDDLKVESINVHLYATPEGVSKRMEFLEKNLTGQWRLNLAFAPSRNKENWKQIDNDQTLQVWDVPFMVTPYRRALQTAITYNDPRNREKLAEFSRDESYIDVFPLIRKAKSLYLKGKLESEEFDADTDATSIFFDLIYPESVIRALPTDTPLLESLGIRRANQSQLQFQQEVANMQFYLYLIRADACYYTALCHLENQNPSTALNWLDRVSTYEPEGILPESRWEQRVTYMKSRINELMGKFDEANKLLKSVEPSPQQHGDFLRARHVKRIAAAK
jgi:hypothetical protein